MTETGSRLKFLNHARVLKNASGTAPGMWFEKDGTIYISMPGVPHEMKHLMTEHVLPEFKKRFTSQIIIHREYNDLWNI